MGIELVPVTSAPKEFEVRYYKDAEAPGAQRIVGIMDNAGVQAKLVDLNLETNPRVRRNHFEVWCPANARAHKLRPIVSPPS